MLSSKALILAAAAATVSATNPGLNVWSDWNYGGSVYYMNYAPSGACVDLPSSVEGSASSARLTGTSCCLYQAYECEGSVHYLIQQDLAQFPGDINDHLGSVKCWNGYTPSSCASSNGPAQTEPDANKTARSGLSKRLQSLESGLSFRGGNHVGDSLTVYAEAVGYSGGDGIPGGIVYSGAAAVSADIYQDLNDRSDGDSGYVEVGGVTIFWEVNTDNGSETMTNLLNNDLSQSLLTTILTDALEGLLNGHESEVEFELSAQTVYYNGFSAKFTISV